MSTGQTRLAQAQADLQAAELVIAGEHREQLKERLKAAIEEGRAIDERLTATGAELVKARAQSEPLWTQREVISRTRTALDKEFQAKDFPSDEEAREYESKRGELTDQWQALTAQISTFSDVIARDEAEYERLKFARSRAAMAVNDLRLGIRGELVGAQRM
jgi:chromosome segregation ATPase